MRFIYFEESCTKKNWGTFKISQLQKYYVIDRLAENQDSNVLFSNYYILHPIELRSQLKSNSRKH